MAGPRRWAAAAVLLGFLLGWPAGGCVRGSAYPLYPNPERPRPASEVAYLTGPIRIIDGQEVASKGRAFLLLPGCHLVETSTSVGGEGPGGSSWSAHMPALTYPFRTRAGYRYKISLDRQEASGPVFRIWMTAWEHDPKGGRVPVSPASSTDDLEACRRWAP